jgi:hypothetical protein
MRLSLAMAATVASAQFIAGCATLSQGTPNTTVPFPSSQATSVERQVRSAALAFQARPKWHFSLKAPGNSVGLWASLINFSYLLGQDKRNLKKTIFAIDTKANGCIFPNSVKIDHARNIWTACENSTTGRQSAYQEYNSEGKVVATYATGPATNCPGSGFYGHGYDGASNSSNVVFLLYSVNCNTISGGGYEFWPAGFPSTVPTLYIFPYGSPVQTLDFGDLDSNGNLWFDYYGCLGGKCGYGAAEETAPFSASRSMQSIIAPGTKLACPGGIYASKASTVINVIDCNSRDVYQFDEKGSQIGTLGPVSLLGYPYDGGFNQTDSAMAIADVELDALEVGKIPANTWKVERGVYMATGLGGAAYTPSDK